MDTTDAADYYLEISKIQINGWFNQITIKDLAYMSACKIPIILINFMFETFIIAMVLFLFMEC